MAVTSAGAISLQDIADEFGGTTPHSLSEYYRGGSFIDADKSPFNIDIPSSGEIDLADFYATQKTLWITEISAQGFVVPKEGVAYEGYQNGSYGEIIDDTTVDFLGGARIHLIQTGVSLTTGEWTVTFTVSGSVQDSGFTNLYISTYVTATDSYDTGTYARADATHVAASDVTYWRWAGVSSPGNPRPHNIVASSATTFRNLLHFTA